MAIIYRAPNENFQEVEAYIAKESAKTIAWEKKNSKKRPFLLALYILLILITVTAVLYILFSTDVLNNIIITIKNTLNLWANQLSFSRENVENADYSGDFGERILSAILGFLGIILQTIVSLLLNLLALLSPMIVVAGFLAAGGFTIYLCCNGIGYIGWRSATSEEIRRRVIKSMDKRMKRLYAGVEGELRALDSVAGLDDNCFVFANVEIWLDGHRNETDLIVVSPTGLTIVEVKNYSGIILGDLSQPEIIQRKYRKNRKYSDEPRSNPVHQIEAPAQKLTEFLKRKGISVFVRRCALFIHDNVDIRVTDRQGLSKSCPLFLKESLELLQYLHSHSRQYLSDKEISQIVSALRTLL